MTQGAMAMKNVIGLPKSKLSQLWLLLTTKRRESAGGVIWAESEIAE